MARDKERGEHKQNSRSHRHYSGVNGRDGDGDRGRDGDWDRVKGEFSVYDRDTNRDDMNVWGEGGRAEEQGLAVVAGRGGEEEAKGEGRGRMVAEPKSSYSRGSGGGGASGGDSNYRGADSSGGSSAKSMDEDAWRGSQWAGEEEDGDREAEEEEDWTSLKARVVRLTHTNRTLMQALQEEHALRAASDERSKRLDQDLAESHTACEVAHPLSHTLTQPNQPSNAPSNPPSNPP